MNSFATKATQPHQDIFLLASLRGPAGGHGSYATYHSWRSHSQAFMFLGGLILRIRPFCFQIFKGKKNKRSISAHPHHHGWHLFKLLIALCLSEWLVISWHETLVLAHLVWNLSVGKFSILWLQRDPCLSPLVLTFIPFPVDSLVCQSVCRSPDVYQKPTMLLYT